MSPDYTIKPRFAEIQRPFVVPIIEVAIKHKKTEFLLSSTKSTVLITGDSHAKDE